MSRFLKYLTEMKILSYDSVQKKRKGFYYFEVNDKQYIVKISDSTNFGEDNIPFYEVVFTINGGERESINRPLDKKAKYLILNKMITALVRLVNEDSPDNFYFHTKDENLMMTYIGLFDKFKSELKNYHLEVRYLFNDMYFFFSNNIKSIENIRNEYPKNITENNNKTKFNWKNV